MTAKQLDEIKARAEAATQGPWTFDANCTLSSERSEILHAGETGFVASANAEFIAHAREDIPALLAEIERLQARERELLLALSKAAPRPTYSPGGAGPRMYDGTFCVICQAELNSPDRPWKRWFGHNNDCIVKPAEALAKEGDTR